MSQPVFRHSSHFKIAVILREPKRLKNPAALTTSDPTSRQIVRNFTGSFDSFHSLRMTRNQDRKDGYT